ncbi:hypothetical protein N657DRAFT_208706 [Parathielavia appendiculata]|uniref:Uncharacterized protein n=1 Tax=Parathielavia appendiculata TaxID=2587402 RepID=A0AAN6U6X5_9PEZI|nr:hypothetical protein N657DRAFT_208706 [Parathielavia appendiculata]
MVRLSRHKSRAHCPPQCNPLDAQHHASSDRLQYANRQPHQTPPHPPFLLSGSLGSSTPHQPVACSELLPISPTAHPGLFSDKTPCSSPALPQTPGSLVGSALALAGRHTQIGNGATVQPDQMPRSVESRRPQISQASSTDTVGRVKPHLAHRTVARGHT